jgi:hypothetical protein
MISKNLRINLVIVVVFSIFFLFFSRSTKFYYFSNFIGKNTDNFNGYLWWLNSFSFIENKSNFPFWKTTAINYPNGEFWLNQFDEQQVIEFLQDMS